MRISKANPKLKVICQDLPKTVEAAKDVSLRMSSFILVFNAFSCSIGKVRKKRRLSPPDESLSKVVHNLQLMA